MKKLSKKLTSKWSLKEPLYIKKQDKRYKGLKNQLKANGFCDSETWALYSVIAEFVLPRLIRFRELNNGFPMGLTPEQWDNILDKIIFAFDWTLNDCSKENINISQKERDKNYKKCEEGLQLFAKWFRYLWR